MKLLCALGAALAVAWPSVAAPAAPAAPTPSEKDFKGIGRCQFAAHGFVLAPQTQQAVTESVQKLLERHQSVFGFRTRPDFQVRIRVFGRFEDYTNAALRFYWTN